MLKCEHISRFFGTFTFEISKSLLSRVELFGNTGHAILIPKILLKNSSISVELIHILRGIKIND